MRSQEETGCVCVKCSRWDSVRKCSRKQRVTPDSRETKREKEGLTHKKARRISFSLSQNRGPNNMRLRKKQEFGSDRKCGL